MLAQDKELHCKVSFRLEMDSNSARQALQRRGPGGLKHVEVRCLSIQQWVTEKRLSAGRVIRKATQQTSSRFFFERDRERSRHPRNVGYISMKTRTIESLTTALPIEQESKSPQCQQLTECTPRRHRHLYMSLLFFNLFTVRHR